MYTFSVQFKSRGLYKLYALLPHEHFGSYLGNKGISIDYDLEKRNFQQAGETCSKMRRKMKIGNYDVLPEYRKPEHSLQDLRQKLIMRGIALTSVNPNISCNRLNARTNPVVSAREVH